MGKLIKAWVAHAELMAIMFMAGPPLMDVQYETLFPELQYDDPNRLTTVMRSYDVLHASGTNH
eukprot:12897809-Prorocentrum_lima.AAC.1